MLTNIKGNVAEAKVLTAFAERGYHVLVPFGDGQPYDLVVHLPVHRSMLRVQCKSARQLGQSAVFNCRSTDHGRGPQPYTGAADIFGVYFPPTDVVYVVAVNELAGFEGRLRLTPALNNQRRGIRMAQDYEIDRWSSDRLSRLGFPQRKRTHWLPGGGDQPT